MSEFLKSAMGYFTPQSDIECSNEFIGQMVEVGSVTLQVKQVIAEGLYTKKYIIFCVS